jgi:hypothetical protein
MSPIIYVRVFLASAISALISCDNSSDSTSPRDRKGLSVSDTASGACKNGVGVTPQRMGVTGTDINVRKGPGTEFEKVVNKKASDALGRTHYVKIDAGVTLIEFCQDGEWSYVEVDEPDWLRKSHIGWVHMKFLVSLGVSSDEIRQFVVGDFIWDGVTAPYKELIMSGVNKVHAENSRCDVIDPTSAYLSKSKSKPGNPVFFVTCGRGSGVFNVFFSKEEVESSKAFQAAVHIDKVKAANLCEGYAKGAANHPSTVSFSRVLDFILTEHPNGRTRIDTTFKAKNSFGLEEKFAISCLLSSGGLIEANVFGG